MSTVTVDFNERASSLLISFQRYLRALRNVLILDHCISLFEKDSLHEYIEHTSRGERHAGFYANRGTGRD